MYIPDLDRYREFGFYRDYVHDPNDPMSIYNAKKSVLIDPDLLPLHHQIRLKRCHDKLSQQELGKIVRLPASTISLIETGQRLIPKNRLNEFETYMYEEIYVDGELFFRVDQDEDEPLDMTIDEQRALWKQITDNQPKLRGTIL